MPNYKFTAQNISTGEERTGSMFAKSDSALFHQLRSEGFLLTFHEEEKESQSAETMGLMDKVFGGVSLKDKMLFARNLSVMISSGVQVTKAINTLVNQTKNKRFQKALHDIAERVQSGTPLGDALAKYPDIFSNLFVSMVRVGELGGNLEEVLVIVSVQLEKEHDLISKVRGAMMYPAVILTAMVGVGVLMLTYILPKITSVFSDMEVKLPASTQFIIGVSNFLRGHAILVSIAVVVIIICLSLFAKTVIGKRVISFLLLHFPVVKEIVIKTNSARFARIYSSLLKSGVSVVEALRVISETLSNYAYRTAILRSMEDVQKGINLSESISRSKVFPPLVYQIVEVGESTGKTEEVLLKLAEFYEADVDQMTKNMSSIIEPLLMIVIGTGVGFFAVAMLTPMYSVLDNIK